MKEESPYQPPTEALRDIRLMMEKSSRFISLSGLSGIAAGVTALAGVYLFLRQSDCWSLVSCLFPRLLAGDKALEQDLFSLAAIIFFTALLSAFFFTWLRSKKNRIPLWGPVAIRVLWSVTVPILAGAVFIYHMIQLEQYELVVPGMLVFYGLALINGSKYTVGEIRYLGYCQVILGLICCWYPNHGLYFWATGFGLLHIVYGVIMWLKYERETGI